MSVVSIDKADHKYRDSMAKVISLLWFKWDSQREPKKREWKELRDYLFATDTYTTSNSALPWKNSTTYPKLTQIRDNLHSNYISALFPNDAWLKWEAWDENSAIKAKADVIQGYMTDRTREGDFRDTVDKLLYDYIDYGNAFCTREGVYDVAPTPNGPVEVFIGPKIRRISPYDIVFDPTAEDFHKAPKIVRKLISVGECLAKADEDIEGNYLKDAFKNREKLRQAKKQWKYEDFNKADGYNVDGFGNFFEYLDSDMVELLTYYGDFYDRDTQKLYKNRVITVMDRTWVLRNDVLDTLDGHAPIWMVNWRIRPDNLWGMGPLDNLVGMQYRIDHIQNLKADAMDLAVLPPMVIQGEVEEFEYAPGAEIHVDVNGGVSELNKNINAVIQAENEAIALANTMEEFAGAPKEAMGIRTPGEKTMFEVQQLQNAAGRIFQEKVTRFELMLEKVLNSMLKLAITKMNTAQVVRIIRDDLGAEVFKTITAEDLNASGILRPIGARHYARQATMFQDMLQVFGSPLGQMIAPHVSSKALAELVEDQLGLKQFHLVQPFVGIAEQAEQAQAVDAMGEEMEYNRQKAIDENHVGPTQAGGPMTVAGMEQE